MSNILRKHWSIVQQGCPNIEAFKSPPLMSYKRDRNLRDDLVRSDIEPKRTESIQRTLMPAKMGNFPCLQCACCNNLVKVNSFTHPGKNFKVIFKVIFKVNFKVIFTSLFE